MRHQQDGSQGIPTSTSVRVIRHNEEAGCNFRAQPEGRAGFHQRNEAKPKVGVSATGGIRMRKASITDSDSTTSEHEDGPGAHALIDNPMSMALTSEGHGHSVALHKATMTKELDTVFRSIQQDVSDEGLLTPLSRSSSRRSEDVSDIEPGVSELREELHNLLVDFFDQPAFNPEKKHKSLPVVLRNVFGFEKDLEETEEFLRVRDSTIGKFDSVRLGAYMKRGTLCYNHFVWFRNFARQVIDDAFFMSFYFCLTIWSLFGPDLVVVYGDKDSETPVSIFNSVVFVFFVIEMMFHAAGSQKYLYSVSLILDLVALLSFLSDTWFYQGDLFGSEQGTKISRYARSARMTRLLRIARVARVTRLAPHFLQLFGGQKHTLAKVAMARRLRRIFKFMDTTSEGLVSILDFKFFFVALVKELSGVKEMPPRAKVEMLRGDFATIKSCSDPDLYFSDCYSTLSKTGSGKILLEMHIKEARRKDGGWMLTQQFSGIISLKVCVGLLMIVILFNLLQPDVEDESMDVGFALLAETGRLSQEVLPQEEVCRLIGDYVNQFGVVLLFLENVTYVDQAAGVQCSSGGISRAESGPFARMDDLISMLKFRDRDVHITCYPQASIEGQDEGVCNEELARSGALIDIESKVRDATRYDLYETCLVIACLLLWTFLFNASISSFSSTLLQPLGALADDMKAMTSLELVHIDAGKDSEPEEATKLTEFHRVMSIRASQLGKMLPDWITRHFCEEESGKKPDRVADEVALLQTAFMHMQTSIRSWTKYVPPSVVQRLLTAGMGATIGVTPRMSSILFCDIDGFEETCRDTTPDQVLALLQSVLRRIGDIVDREGGTLLEFIGDEVLAVFNAPNVLKDHSLHASQSAVEITKVAGSLRLLEGRVVVKCRCGVHTAKILAGNLGSTSRMKYGLLGDGVNLAARLKGLNSRYSTQSLATDAVLQDDRTMRRILYRPVDKVAVKGRTEPTTVYELLGMNRGEDAEIYGHIAAKHEEAYRLYYNRSFLEAKVLFTEVRAAMRELGRVDEPSKQLIGRCNAHLRNPPPPDWDGVERLTAKTFVVHEETEELVS